MESKKLKAELRKLVKLFFANKNPEDREIIRKDFIVKLKKLYKIQRPDIAGSQTKSIFDILSKMMKLHIEIKKTNTPFKSFGIRKEMLEFVNFADEL